MRTACTELAILAMKREKLKEKNNFRERGENYRSLTSSVSVPHMSNGAVLISAALKRASGCIRSLNC